MNKLITILTPTYNRAKLLDKLYCSLLDQTNKNFIWLIIDDGSTDQTADIVKQFISENKIDIKYIYKSNGGKHTALNVGINKIDTELTFIVDSDDYLPKDSVEIIFKYHEKYKAEANICGYSFLKCYPDGTVNTAYFPQDEKIESYISSRINGGIGGDKAEVFFTKCLKEFPFPEYSNEKFLPEDLVWMVMAHKYEMVHINKCIYFCEYLEGGLTKSGKYMKVKSPNGMYERSKIYLYSNCNLKVKIKHILLFLIYGKFSKKTLKTMWNDCNEKLLFILFFLPSSLLFFYWKRRYKVNNE